MSMSAAFLQEALRAGTIAPLDAHFAEFLARHSRSSQEVTALAGALLSAATGQGHVCIELDALHEAAAGALPPAAELRAALQASGALAEAGRPAPMVLDKDNLYLYRYWQYEEAVASDLLDRSARLAPIADDASMRAALARHFPETAGEGAMDQQGAAALALLQSLCIISGGPGTGKTTTVLRVLAMLLELSPRPLRIALAAPTGKAASRLQEAMRRSCPKLDLPPAIDARLPREAQTLHRLLGRTGGTGFRHNRDNPLPLDVLVVDEASMIDLAMMAKLLAALPPSTRLIVLGDKDQLDAVEAGAVLSSLCAHAGRYSRAMAERLQSLTGRLVEGGDRSAPLADNIATLRRAYRFDAGGAIGALAAASLRADADAVLDVLSGMGDAKLIESMQPGQIVPALAEPYLPLLEAARPGADAQSALELTRRYTVLCAHREGPYGAVRINTAIEKYLRQRCAVPAHAEWYPGRVVIMNRNDYGLGLFNGEIGLCLRDADGELAVYFPAARGGAARFAVARLSACGSAFALTVHKAQGSEFDEVALLLPQRLSAISSRELFYTAVTRAARGIRIFASKENVRATLTQRALRRSALAARLV
jgi:exodeoxyribonuclease V alpha subunit